MAYPNGTARGLHVVNNGFRRLGVARQSDQFLRRSDNGKHLVLDSDHAVSDAPWLPSFHCPLLTAAREFVKRALKRTLVDLLAGISLLDRLKSVLRGHTAVALTIFPNDLRQIEACRPLSHVFVAYLRGEMESTWQTVARRGSLDQPGGGSQPLPRSIDSTDDGQFVEASPTAVTIPHLNVKPSH
jgi:hypothetical protein